MRQSVSTLTRFSPGKVSMLWRKNLPSLPSSQRPSRRDQSCFFSSEAICSAAVRDVAACLQLAGARLAQLTRSSRSADPSLAACWKHRSAASAVSVPAARPSTGSGHADLSDRLTAARSMVLLTSHPAPTTAPASIKISHFCPDTASICHGSRRCQRPIRARGHFSLGRGRLGAVGLRRAPLSRGHRARSWRCRGGANLPG